MSELDNWENDLIQFARLLSEIRAVGLNTSQVSQVLESMDISRGQLDDLLERAEMVFENAKPE